jgi:predicted TPR repeat methyltransferase
MVDHRITYNEQARQYDDLVRREDYQHNLLPAIQRWVNLEGKIAADLGAGTGRVSELIAPFVRQLYSFDLSMAMLSAWIITRSADPL